LGALDDDPKLSGCLPEDPTDGTPYIMSPNTNLSAVRWSECSKKAVTQLFQYVQLFCRSKQLKGVVLQAWIG